MIAILAGWLVGTAPVAVPSDRRVTQLAPGVYSIEHAETADGFGSGNTTVIIGSRQVLVVDAGFLPSTAREDIAQIRRWTNQPVTFLLTTHFHNDHNLANRTYLDSFPGLTIIAQTETKVEMDRFGPGSESREERSTTRYQQMLSSGKTSSGRAITPDERKAITEALAVRAPGMAEIHGLKFQSATLTFEREFTVDLGEREVQIKFLGRGNTVGDAVAWLPKEEIAVVGDLVVHPIPYIYDGYPAEWSRTLEHLTRLGPRTIVPGHGPVMHDLTYTNLLHDLLESTVTQLNTALGKVGPAMFRTVDDVKGSIDLRAFRQKFAGNDPELQAAFDDMANNLIGVAFKEASLR